MDDSRESGHFDLHIGDRRAGAEPPDDRRVLARLRSAATRLGRGRRAEVVLLSLALAYGGGAWLVYLHHAEGHGESGEPPLALHILRDSTLALPAVLIAVVIAMFLASRIMRLVPSAGAGAGMFATALATGIGASVAFGAGVPLHGWLFKPAGHEHGMHWADEEFTGSVLSHMMRDGQHAGVVTVPIALIVLLVVYFRRQAAAGTARRTRLAHAKLSVAGASMLSLAGAGAMQVAADVPGASLLRDNVNPCFNNSPVAAPFQRPMPIPPLKTINPGTPQRATVVEQRAETEIIPGIRTPVWAYDGTVPGPTFMVDKSEAKEGTNPLNVEFQNNLPPNEDPTGIIFKDPPPEPTGDHPNIPSSTSVHQHGINGDHFSDGYPDNEDGHRHQKNPGESFEHVYPNNEYQRPATYWYHDHSVHITSQHVYRGLAGLYITQDSREKALPLPRGYGVHDIPLVLKDVMISPGGIKGADQEKAPPKGTLIYDNCSHMGAFGDVMTVNGKQQPKFPVTPRKYRFRMLNGSDARQYLFALRKVENLDRPVDDPKANEPFTVIGSDHGLLRNPEPAKMKGPESSSGSGSTTWSTGDSEAALDGAHITPAERLEFVVDFKKYAGQRLVMVNLLAEEDDRKLFPLMRFDVSPTPVPDESEVPPVLRPDLNPATTQPDEHEADLQEPTETRFFEFNKSNGPYWAINGRIFEPLKDDGKPGLNTTERWVLENKSGGWGHPIHLHLGRFRIVDIDGRAPRPSESGWKDVVWLGPNQRITVEHQWWNFNGRYVFHCHNGSHEDFDMMSQVEVQPAIPPASETRPPAEQE